jgi:hypothetical protein
MKPPRKVRVEVFLDNDGLAWIRSIAKDGHVSRVINRLLRNAMNAERAKR